MGGNEALTLERFAELRAEMDTGELRDDVLRRERLSPEAWVAAQKTWLEKMGGEIERGRFELTNRYSAAFVARQGSLSRAKPEPTAAVPSAALPAAKTTSPAEPAAPTAAPDRRAALPSYLQAAAEAAAAVPLAPPPPAAATPPPPRQRSPLQATAMAMDLPVRASLPFQAGAPAAPPPRATSDAPAKSTLGMTSHRVEAAPASTPFVKPAAAATGGVGVVLKQYAALSAELELSIERTPEILAAHGLDADSKAALDARWQAKFSQDGVAALDYLRLLAQEKARLKASGSARPAAKPARAAPPPAAAGAAPAKAGLAATSMNLDLDAAIAAALPFGAAAQGARASAPTPAPATRAAGPTPSADAPKPRPAPVGSGTAFIPEEMVAQAAVPFAGTPKAAAPARGPDLTLQQYASLCAELAVYPERADSIRLKYRVGDAQAMAALEGVWRDRFARDAAARADWQKQVEQFQRWLRSQR